MIKVSVIVPVYNVEKYLPRCLDSLVNQTLQEIEIIAVDDCSPDRSIDILRDYEQRYPEKVKVIQSPENRRQGGARNLGIRAAEGEYIGFVDSDDWADLTMFEKLYTEAMNSHCDVVDCDYYLAFADHQVIERSNKAVDIGELDLDRKKRLVLNPGRTWTKIYHRRLFVEENIYFPEHLFYEDNEIMPILMASARKLGKVAECLYFYHVGSGGSTTERRNSYHHFDRLQTSINMRQHFIDRGIYETFKDEIDYRFIKLYYINTIPLCMNKFDPPEIKYLQIIRQYMKQNFPDYRQNPYFKRKEKAWYKIISRCTDWNPRFALTLNGVVRKTVGLIPKAILKRVLSPRSALLGDLAS